MLFLEKCAGFWTNIQIRKAESENVRHLYVHLISVPMMRSSGRLCGRLPRQIRAHSFNQHLAMDQIMSFSKISMPTNTSKQILFSVFLGALLICGITGCGGLGAGAANLLQAQRRVPMDKLEDRMAELKIERARIIADIPKSTDSRRKELLERLESIRLELKGIYVQLDLPVSSP